MELLNETVSLAAEGLQAELCKMLEHIASKNRLLMRARVGLARGPIARIQFPSVEPTG
jgi:hypothetical protein